MAAVEGICLMPLDEKDREKFIEMNQASFQVAVDKEFGPEAGVAIPRRDIEESLDSNMAHCFSIMLGDKMIGGTVCQINPKSVTASLDLLFVDPEYFGKGYGLKAWELLESKFPEIRIWETHTPYFETRNIHFYVNKCGFHIVEFYCPSNPMKKNFDEFPGDEFFFRMEKRRF